MIIKRINILKEFKKEVLCESLLRIQIIKYENAEKLQKGTEKYEIFLSHCRDYFLEIIFKSKEENYVKNELLIIKNEEIREVFLKKKKVFYV